MYPLWSTNEEEAAGLGWFLLSSPMYDVRKSWTFPAAPSRTPVRTSLALFVTLEPSLPTKSQHQNAYPTLRKGHMLAQKLEASVSVSGFIMRSCKVHVCASTTTGNAGGIIPSATSSSNPIGNAEAILPLAGPSAATTGNATIHHFNRYDRALGLSTAFREDKPGDKHSR